MKKNHLSLIVPLLLLLPISHVIHVGLPEAKPVSAGSSSYTGASLPTTIDLNDVSIEKVRAYYAPLEGKDYSGNDLLKALKPILSSGQQHYSYDTGSNIWKAYEITDRDWSKSPASATIDGTFDPEKNIITGYKYGSSVSNPGNNNPYLRLLYRNDGETDGDIQAWGPHGGNNGNGIDREHVWPKSRGFDSGNDGNYGARGDLHHLMAADHTVNSNYHNNLPYAFIDMNKSFKDAGSDYSYDDGNLTGLSLNVSSSVKVFEPQDRDKGDIARACFYMVARYNNISGDDDTIDSGNPNLTLDDTLSTATESSTANKAVSLGVLRDLLAWHRLDPVDDFERHRNDLLYLNYTKNRNPFIDYPSWVDAVWGGVLLGSDKRTITFRDETPIGKASPSKDSVYGQYPGEEVSPIASISIEGAKTSFEVGDAFNFGGKVIGKAEDNSTREVTLECTFSGYDMSKAGDYQVTVTHTPSGKSASYTIKVVEKATPSSSEQPSSSGSSTPSVDPKPSPADAIKSIPLPIIIGIGAGAVVVIILLIIIFTKLSKKQKKAVTKAVKKTVKSASKSSKKKK